MRKLLNVVLTVIGLMFLSSGVAAAYDNSNSIQVAYNDHQSDRLGSFVQNLVKPIADPRDLECLAKNIFYESGSEPYEGKVAVGMVTMNRARDSRFPNSICGVVRQRTVTSVPKRVTNRYVVRTGYLNRLEERTEVTTIWQDITVCQFSWNCNKVSKPKSDDPRWLASQAVAQELLTGGYDDHEEKYGNLKFFHATYVRPAWNGLKRIVRIGGHVFYARKDE
jgi:spore germination cell wall hydrolase CwlJ-like protein